MQLRAGLLLVAALILPACAGGEWPGLSRPDPTVEEYSIVKQRWLAASTSPLGSAQDLAAITAALKSTHPDVTIREVRWLNPTEAMVQCVREDALGIGQELFYGAVKKSGSGWQLVAWYTAVLS